MEKNIEEQCFYKSCNKSIVSSLYDQFLVDIPRVRIYIDGELENSSPQCIFAIIVNKYEFQTGIRFAFWCTQTSLAPIYMRKVEEINPEFHRNEIKYHLLDNGEQKINVTDNVLTIQYNENSF